ncbi:alpha/beta fold hydrolase [Streptomyces violaceorubidus]|uniref:alpha/beta fold hydrolase n=1 Tax=Streptomyces violaceorubidus TaxID=284042 RepID=UPI0004C232C0|nr:alpha/beta hydrolase [Streptomyces violaceorubidus]
MNSTAPNSATAPHPAAVRGRLDLDGRPLSYLDFGGAGSPIVGLHGHLSEGSSFTPFAQTLEPKWRLIAPDQRGHGDSGRAADYSREGYLADIEALLDHLALDRVVLLGHSLGAVNAYQFAARHPQRVTALINVEGAACLGLQGPNPFAFLLGQPYEATSREQLLTGMGPAAPYFADRLRQNPDGTWRLPFHPQDMYHSEDLVHGDHWADWTASDCPALLMHGTRGIIPAEQIEAMVRRRPGTVPIEIDADHLIPTTAPDTFAAEANRFLASL